MKVVEEEKGSGDTEEEVLEESNHHVERVRKEAEDFIKGVFSDEVKLHMIAAGSELLLALDAMIPRTHFTEESRRHYHTVKREILLTVKSVVDTNLGTMDDKKHSHRLRKIELE